jgi:hypothetical protein
LSLLLPCSGLLQPLRLPCPLARWWLEEESVSVVSTGISVTNARSAAAQASVSTGGSVANARSVAAQASASTSGGVTDARTAAAHPFASTGGGITNARSVAAQASASTGGCVVNARSAAAAMRVRPETTAAATSSLRSPKKEEAAVHITQSMPWAPHSIRGRPETTKAADGVKHAALKQKYT